MAGETEGDESMELNTSTSNPNSDVVDSVNKYDCLPECFKCVVCQVMKTGNPSLILPCLHHVCVEGCVDGMSKNGKMKERFKC